MIKRKSSQPKFLLPFCAIVLSSALPVFAELNGNVSTVDVDRRYVAGTLSTTPRSGSTIYEIRDSNGTLIREYVSPSGQIFAIAWEGHFVPEMEHFLGTLFPEYSAAIHAAQPSHGWRQSLLIHIPVLTFENGGHMGWYFGRAFVPSSVPTNFPIEDIR